MEQGGKDMEQYAEYKQPSQEANKDALQPESLAGKFSGILSDPDIAATLGPVIERMVPGFVETGLLTQAEGTQVMESTINATHQFTGEQRQTNADIVTWMTENGLFKAAGADYGSGESEPFSQTQQQRGW